MDREAEMTEWNDGRLDDLSKRVDDGFAKVDHKFEHLEKKMDAGFAQIDSKFEALHRMLFQAAWGLAIGLLTLMGVMVF